MKNFENILNHEDHLSILKEKLNTTTFTFLEVKWSPQSEKVEGFLGDHYILTLKYKIDGKITEDKFFIKTKPKSNPSQLKIAEKQSFYIKESYIYMEVFKKFEELGYDVSFAPKCYLCKNIETLVLEDMKSKGFKLMEEYFLTMEQCKAALTAVAKFHASSLAFEEKMSMELGRKFRFDEESPEAFKEIFYDPLGKTLGRQYDASTTKCLMELSKLLPETAQWKEDFIKKISKFNTIQIFGTELPYRKTCGHGDLWTNNMLFRINSDQIECVLVDFQAIRYHHPSVDALLVLYLCTSSDFRKDLKNELLDFHYAEMASYLASYGFDLEKILPKTDYLESSRIFEAIACFQGAGSRSMNLLSPEIINKIVKSTDQEFHDLLFSDLRSKLAVEAFNTDNYYREVLTNDIYDMYKVLSV